MMAQAVQQFSAASLDVVQHVKALGQSLSIRRHAFHQRLAEAEELNDAQTEPHRMMDVGGVPFCTHTKTLQRYEGMLAAMVSDDFRLDDGWFLDRDPTWFPLVLHLLRTGNVLLPEDTQKRGDVVREMQYYCLGEQQAATQKQIIVIGNVFTTEGDPPDEFLCERYMP